MNGAELRVCLLEHRQDLSGAIAGAAQRGETRLQNVLEDALEAVEEAIRLVNEADHV